MSDQQLIEEMDFPEEIKLSLDGGLFIIFGPKGELKKNLSNPALQFKIEQNKIQFFAVNKYSKREKKLINTYKAKLKKYFKGVQEGHTYRLKICSGHFPMSVSVKGTVFEVKNFIGENTPRVIQLKEGASVKINGDEIVVEGIDLDVVSQTSADIEMSTRRPGFDKRVFMDGIWIVEKDGVTLK